MIRNPYYLAAFPLILVIALYSLKWGTVLLPLSSKLQIFLLIFTIFLILFGFLFSEVFSKSNVGSEEVVLEHKSSKYQVFLVLLLTLIEGAYFRGFPIMGIISYSNFGIPFFHPLILTFNSYVLVSFLYEWGASFRMKKKNIRLFPILLLIIPYIIEVNRGMLVMVMVSGVIAFMVGANINISLKNSIKLTLSAVAGVYMFGLAGNYRTNFSFVGSSRYFNSFYIMSLGGAQTIGNSNIINPFYWGYIYLTSSLANLEATVSQITLSSSTMSSVKFAIVQFFPDFISKRMYPSALDTAGTRINSQFTTGTVFNSSYYLYGWDGMILTAVFVLIFPIILHILLKNAGKKYYVVAFSFLGTMYVFLTFDNMIGFTGLSLPILYAIFGALVSRKKSRYFEIS